jgi:arylsulfatase A-like enzyme
LSGTEYEADATMEIGGDDGTLVDLALADFAHLSEPYVAVVHMSNTHFPYKISSEITLPDEDSDEDELRARYHASIYLQDHHLARLIKGVRARPESERTIIIFTSDHGEQTREHGATGHTGTLFEQEVRIPFWIDAPKATLTASERENLEKLKDVPLFNLDILPTILDLAGVWDEPNMAEHRARMAGQSLLRGGSSPDRALVLSNCTELWQCAFRNWGAMKGSRKAISHQGDYKWNCFDIKTDPQELDDLGAEACSDLIALAEQGRGRPFSAH